MLYPAKKNAALCLLIVTVSFLAYMNTLPNGFVWDDEYVLEANPYVREIENIPSFFISSKTQGSYDMKAYRPLRQAMFVFEHKVFSLNPLGYHFMNIVLHGLNAVLALIVFQRLGFDLKSAGAMAILYSLHPLNSEVVANITGRTDLLFTLFYLLGLIAYLNYSQKPRKLYLAAVLLSFFLSLMSKEMAVTFPFIILLTEYYFRKGGIKEHLPLYAGLFVILLSYLFIRQYAVGDAGVGGYYGDSFWITFFSETRILLYYIKLFLMPYPLTARYDIVLIESVLNPYTLAFIALGAALLFATFARQSRKSFPLYLYGIWWFLITLMPVSNIIPIRAAMMGERYMYIPMIGLIIFLGAMIKKIPLENMQGNKAVIAAIVSILIVLGSLTINRNRVWKNNITLFEDAKIHAPDSLAVHWNLFNEYQKTGNRELAAQEYLEMKRINRKNALMHLKTAIRYKNLGRLEDARRMAQKALRTKPDLKEASDFLVSIEDQ